MQKMTTATAPDSICLPQHCDLSRQISQTSTFGELASLTKIIVVKQNGAVSTGSESGARR